MTIQGITENDISNYLLNTPGFFERHAELLATVQLQQKAAATNESQCAPTVLVDSQRLKNACGFCIIRTNQMQIYRSLAAGI